ncbi:MAG: PilZ domain-containing protein [Candidatus Saccharicenans sp.]|nr:PilZ domain-containing protein [Candidatus Saccharicenans sp.]MDI6849531.1 PilZ domain-containing protein [Candidatus Saccharicenans sp.]
MNVRHHRVQGLEQPGGDQATVREFSLTLPMTVSGLDARGQEFQENSVLSTISSEQASFLLKTRVERKTVLKLVISLPPKLADGQPLVLVIKGRVKGSEQVPGQPELRRVILELDSRYFIGAGED